MTNSHDPGPKIVRPARRMRRLSDIQDTTAKPIWMEHIPAGRLGFIFGPRGAGKGVFAMRVAADLSRQGKRTLFASREDTDDDIKARAIVAGADPDFVYAEGDLNLQFPESASEFQRRLVMFMIDYVVLDTATSYGRTGTGSDKGERLWAEPLGKVAERAGSGILGTHRARKGLNPKVPVIDQALGSGGGFVGVCRYGYFIGVHPDDEDALALVPVAGKTQALGEVTPLVFHLELSKYTASDGAVKMHPHLGFAGYSPGLTGMDVLRATVAKATGKGDEGKLGEARKWLINVLLRSSGHRILVTDLMGSKDRPGLAQLDGISTRTLRRGREALQRDGILELEGKGREPHYWRLTDEFVRDFKAKEGGDG